MLALAILIFSTFAEELSESIGKRAAKQKLETASNMVFLTMFWTIMVLILSVILGAPFVLKAAALPVMLFRIGTELALSYFAAKATMVADRTTISFIRLLSIPILLTTDIVLGYHLTSLQILGVSFMFFGLVVAFRHNPSGKRGAGLALTVAVLAAASLTALKWDITHYNSVAAEQITVYSCVLVFYYLISLRTTGSPLKLLLKPATGTQSLSYGVGMAVESFAYAFAPASVIIALKRSLAVGWSIAFGRRYFHEHRLGRKVYAGAILVTGLFLLVLR